MRLARFLTPALVILLGASGVLAAPDVTSVSSASLLDGAVFTLDGGGFGAKEHDAPLKWDDFTGGNPGDVVSGWHTESHVAGYEPRYSTERTRVPGGQSSFQEFFAGPEGNQYNSTLGFCEQQIGRIYISGWFYNETGGGPSRNVKILALRGGRPGMWSLPNGRMDLYPSTSSGHAYVADCSGTERGDDWSLHGDIYSGAWHRLEVWFDIGTPTGGGEFMIWRDLNVWASVDGTFIDDPSCMLTNIYFMSYFAVDTNDASMDWYWDEIYVDDTPARVEIGDAPTWDACEHREIQVPQSWSADRITVAANQGSLPAGSQLYLYVVDANGVTNAEGFPVSFQAGADPGPPGPPGQPHR